MNVWLDDLRDPKDYAPDIKWNWVKTADEAIELLKTGWVRLLSFDHDLDWEHYADPNVDGVEKTGYDVAAWVEQQAFRKMLPPFEWRVHSANPVGAQKIRAAMARADKFWGK
jgi:hypothetical protein